VIESKLSDLKKQHHKVIEEKHKERKRTDDGKCCIF